MPSKILQNGPGYEKLQVMALQEISMIIASTRDVDRVLIEVLKTLSRLLGFQYITISLVDITANTITTKHGIWAGKIDAFPEWLKMSSYSLTDNDIQASIVRKSAYEKIDSWDDRFNKKFGINSITRSSYGYICQSSSWTERLAQLKQDTRKRINRLLTKRRSIYCRHLQMKQLLRSKMLLNLKLSKVCKNKLTI